MEMAVEYAKERKQFERPIGAYQAVSHRCAQMLMEVESARALTYFAAYAADSRAGGARRSRPRRRRPTPPTPAGG